MGAFENKGVKTMIKIGIVDDGAGIFPTLNKLKQVISANFVCHILNDKFPLGGIRGYELFDIGEKAIRNMEALQCDVVVFSSVALSSCCLKKLSQKTKLDLYGCEAPILHASTYTANNVLVIGDKYVTKNISLPNVIAKNLEQFPYLAETCDERAIVRYITDELDELDGTFDCIALASSSMNMYKNCFSRVFPNVQIFDSLEGVARKIRKKYKKLPKEESTFEYLDGNNCDISEKYNFFIE